MPLPDDAEEKWLLKEHTKVKHEILGKYLSGWIRILGKFHKLNIFDCFAGRGQYLGGEIGSPIIIMQTLARIREKMKRPEKAACIFIEKNKTIFLNLQEEVFKERDTFPGKYLTWLSIDCINDEFENVVENLLSTLEKENKILLPSFFFVDPFNFDISLETIKTLARSLPEKLKFELSWSPSCSSMEM